MLAFTALTVGASTWFIPAEAWTEMMREQLQRSGDLESTPLPNVGNFFRIASLVGASVMTFVIAFVISAFTFMIFVFLLGDNGSYKQHLSIIAHTSVITAFGALFTLPLRVVNLDPQLTVSVGTLVPFIPDGYLYNVLLTLDLFSLWAAVLTGIGLAKIDVRRGWKSGAFTLIGVAIVFAMIGGYFR